jgi:hypothetical protein
MVGCWTNGFWLPSDHLLSRRSLSKTKEVKYVLAGAEQDAPLRHWYAIEMIFIAFGSARSYCIRGSTGNLKNESRLIG